MKKYILFLFSVFIISTVSAQCNYNVYSSYIKITAAQTLTAQNTFYWVCQNVVVTVDSSLAGTFFMEQNSKIIFNKASMGCDAVFAKSSCTVINNSSGCVGITGNPSNVTVQNIGSGSAAIGFTCATVNYIYNGVSGPCLSTGIYEISNSKTNPQIYPNPVSINEVLFIENDNEPCELTLYNMNGEFVLSNGANKNQLKLQNVSCGFYMIKIKSKNSEVWKKLIVTD